MEIVRTKGSKFGRFLMGFLFFASALNMLLVVTPTGVAGFFTMLGLPVPLVMAWAVIVVKIVAGSLIMYGKKYVTESAAVLIIFTIIATLLAHMNAEIDPTFPNGLLKNLAIVGGLLYLMAFGPGGMNVKETSTTPVSSM
jgi:putative oxidoreductase